MKSFLLIISFVFLSLLTVKIVHDRIQQRSPILSGNLTNMDLTVQLLHDAAKFFRNIAEQNSSIKLALNQNADTYDQVAAALPGNLANTDKAVQLLHDAADFFRSIAGKNPSMKLAMNQNADVYDQMAILLKADPKGLISNDASNSFTQEGNAASINQAKTGRETLIPRDEFKNYYRILLSAHNISPALGPQVAAAVLRGFEHRSDNKNVMCFWEDKKQVLILSGDRQNDKDGIALGDDFAAELAAALKIDKFDESQIRIHSVSALDSDGHEIKDSDGTK